MQKLPAGVLSGAGEAWGEAGAVVGVEEEEGSTDEPPRTGILWRADGEGAEGVEGELEKGVERELEEGEEVEGELEEGVEGELEEEVERELEEDEGRELELLEEGVEGGVATTADSGGRMEA